MRAQLSLELMLIFAAFLAVLALLIPIIANTYTQTKEEIAVIRARAALDTVAATADELCALAGGSRRKVEISFAAQTQFTAAGKRISAFGIEKTTVCEFYPFSENFTAKKLLLINEGGKIRIKQA